MLCIGRRSGEVVVFRRDGRTVGFIEVGELKNGRVNLNIQFDSSVNIVRNELLSEGDKVRLNRGANIDD